MIEGRRKQRHKNKTSNLKKKKKKKKTRIQKQNKKFRSRVSHQSYPIRSENRLDCHYIIHGTTQECFKIRGVLK